MRLGGSVRWLAGLSCLVLILIPSAAGAFPSPRPGSGAKLPKALTARDGFGVFKRPVRRGGIEGGGLLGSVSGLSPSATQVRLAVVAAAFPDKPFTQPTWRVRNTVFGPLATGSAADYYREVSYGRVELTGEVYGWYLVSHSFAYYEQEAYGLGDYPRCAGRFVLEAVEAADATVDFSQYDNDGPDGVPNSGDDDGFVDVVVVIHAGEGAECGTSSLWSHSFNLSGWGVGAYTTNDRGIGGGNILIDDYVLVPECSCRGSSPAEIGVVCHELGHAFGLPDLYDTEGSGSGVGNWGLMGTGLWGGGGATPETPSHLCAWSKAELGWVTPLPVTSSAQLSLQPVESNPTVYKFWIGGTGSGEYFLVSLRRRRGFDEYVPGEGLMIWHVDETLIGRRFDENTVNSSVPYSVSLEQADGRDDLTLGRNRGDDGDVWPGTAGAGDFDESSVPSSAGNGGSATYIALRQISLGESEASFFGQTQRDIAAPAITVTRPRGGEHFKEGQTVELGWSATDDIGVKAIGLYLCADGGAGPAVTIAEGIPNEPPYECTLPAGAGERYRVRVAAIDYVGHVSWALSAADFSIIDGDAPLVSLSYPSESETLGMGRRILIQWSSDDADPDLVTRLDYSTDDGASFPHLIASGLRGKDSFYWDVPAVASDQVRLRVSVCDGSGNCSSDVSDGRLAIADLDPPVVKVMNPSDGEAFSTGRPCRIEWVAEDRMGVSSITILLSTDGGRHFDHLVAGGLVNQGSYTWYPIGVLSDSCRIVVQAEDYGRNIGQAESQGFFQVVLATSAEGAPQLPQFLDLRQNRPNPFNPVTELEFSVERESEIRLGVFAVSGERVAELASGRYLPGRYRLIWRGVDSNGRAVPSGVYFCMLRRGTQSIVRKMVLIR